MAKHDPISIPKHEYEITAILASGPGGQHVNKVASAVRLRFDIEASSLEEAQKERLKNYADKRIDKKGIINIRVSTYKSQLKNREEAVKRLHILLEKAFAKQKRRIPTKPSKATKKKRLDDKIHRSKIKKMRKKIDF